MSSSLAASGSFSSSFSAGKTLLRKTLLKTAVFFLVLIYTTHGWLFHIPKTSDLGEDIAKGQNALGQSVSDAHHYQTRSLLASISHAPAPSPVARSPLGSSSPPYSSQPPTGFLGEPSPALFPPPSTPSSPSVRSPGSISSIQRAIDSLSPVPSSSLPSPEGDAPSSEAPPPVSGADVPPSNPESGCSCKYSRNACECYYPIIYKMSLPNINLTTVGGVDDALFSAASPPLKDMGQVETLEFTMNPNLISLKISPLAPAATFSSQELSLLKEKLDRNTLLSNPFFAELDYAQLEVEYPPPPPPPSPPPPPPSPPPPPAPTPSPSHSSSGPSIVVIIGAGAGGLVTTLMLLITLFWCWSRRKQPEEEDDFSKIDPWLKGKLGSASHVSSRPSMGYFAAGSEAGSDSHRIGNVSTQMFSYEELQAATNNWEMVLGEGGFGRVYHGKLTSGVEVAIKKLSTGGRQGDREFLAEIDMLSRLHHRHLVKLLGYYSNREATQQLLCYELIPNDSLEAHLHGPLSKKNPPLGWATRLKVAHGAAKGLAYLHEGATPCVIHRDFKASNILLENDFTAKVADFGLAKHAPEGGGRDYVSTRVMGTFGYVAPEYAMTGHLLVKSDVYSYGVVLLELLTGRKPVDMSRPPGQENLVTWARPLIKNEETRLEIADPQMDMSQVPPDTFIEAAVIAEACVNPEAYERPTMGQVVKQLSNIISRTASFQAAQLSELTPLPTGGESVPMSTEHSREPSGMQSMFDSPNMSQIFPPDWPEGLRPPPQGFGVDSRKPSRFKESSNTNGSSAGGTLSPPKGRMMSQPSPDSEGGPWPASRPQPGYTDYVQMSRTAAVSEDLEEGR